MSKFEEIKAELHRLVDNLDEAKYHIKNFAIFSDGSLPPIYGRIRKLLESCQKEPSIEAQLWDLGFTNSYHGTTRFYYSIFDNYIRLCADIENGVTHELRPLKSDTAMVLKSAKFLKELAEK